MRRAGAASLAAHAALLAGMLGWSAWDRGDDAPVTEATVEIVTGHQVNPAGAEPGEASASPSPPQPAPSAPAAPAAAARPTPPPSAGDPGSRTAPSPAARPSPASPAAPPAPPPSPPAGQPEIRLGGASADIGAEIVAGGLNVPASSELGNVFPDYPLEAARRHEEGVVGLRLLVRADGGVEDVLVVRSSGSASLDRAAAERLRTWRFHPATRNGKPMASVAEENVNFTLE